MANLDQILGRGEFQPSAQICVFLPFIGEFGWYIMTYVKRFHHFNHSRKVACCKRGHECLFPSAESFFYDWEDIADSGKAGIIPNGSENAIREKIGSILGNQNIHFVSPSEASWDEKITLSTYRFIPQSLHHQHLQTDIVITPRNRKVDAHRNWTKEKWQIVVDAIVAKGVTVAICGTENTSFNLDNVKYKSWEHTDVDADIGLINNSKLVVTQESGLAYLTFLCKKPAIIMDYAHPEGAPQRDPSVFFENVNSWSDPQILINYILKYLGK